MNPAMRLLMTVSISVTEHMACKVRQRSRREYLVILLDAGLTYLYERSFLQPLWAGAVQGGVGSAVDLRQRGALCRLQVGAVLRGGVAQRQRPQVSIRPGLGGNAVGPATQSGGFD